MSNTETALDFPEEQQVHQEHQGTGSREWVLVPGVFHRYHPLLIRRDYPDMTLPILQTGECRLYVR